MPDDDLPKPERRSQNEKFDDQFLRRYLLGQCSQIESDDLEQAVLLNGEIADLLSATEDELTEEYVENTLSETDLQCFIQRFRTRARVDKIVLTAKLLGRGELPEAFALLDRLRSGDDEVPIWQSGERLPPVSAKDRGYLWEPAERRSSEVPRDSYLPENSTHLKIPPFGTMAPASRSERRFLSNRALSLGVILVAGLSVAGLLFMFTLPKPSLLRPNQKPSITAEDKPSVGPAVAQDLPEMEAAWRQTFNAVSHGNNAEARALFANFNEKVRAYLRSNGRTWQIEYLIGSLNCQFPDSRAGGVRFLTDVLQNNRILNNAGERELQRQIVACTAPMSATVSQPQLPIDLADASAHLQYPGVLEDMKGGFESGEGKVAESAVVISPITSSELLKRRVPLSEPQKALAWALARLPAGATGSVVGSFAVTTKESEQGWAIGIGTCLQRYIPILSQEFQIMPPTYMITIYNVRSPWNVREYARRLHGLHLPLGVSAYSVSEDMSLTAFGSPDDCGSMAHELVHLLIKSNFPMSPAWLEEGLASEVAVTPPKSNGFKFSWSWRDEALSRHFDLRPTVGELLETPWTRFNAVDFDDLPRAAAVQGMAAAFIRYLYSKGALSDVYFSARDQHFSPDLLQYKSYREIVEERLGSKVERIDAEFVQWFKSQ